MADRVQFGPRSGGAGSSDSSPTKASDDKQEAPPLDTIDYPEEEVNVDDIPF